eukprot:Gb_31902 [translate_table: standard]
MVLPRSDQQALRSNRKPSCTYPRAIKIHLRGPKSK